MTLNRLTLTLGAMLACVALASGPAEAAPKQRLEGVLWVLDGATGAPPRQASLQFNGGRVAGSDGCNRIMGNYTLKGGNLLRFAPGGLASTMMACPNMDEANRFHTMLGKVRRYTISDGKLRLRDRASRTFASFSAAP